jgi:hypothetical protein
MEPKTGYVGGMQSLLPYLVFSSLIGCPGSPGDGVSKGDTSSGGDALDTGGDTGVAGCTESGGGTIPDDAEWISFDGVSLSVFSLAEDVLDGEWVGQYGTYDLNRVPIQGANGFKLARPGSVVGVSVRWANLPSVEQPVAVQLWPDFGSDGYMWDAENPIASPTRCLDAASEGAWVEYALEVPVHVAQPVHVFAGYEAAEAADVPEILLEDAWYEGDPPFAGIRFFGVDDEVYHLGMASSWYTWQVRLAVVYGPELDPAELPFQVDEAHGGAGRMAWGDYDNDGDDDLMTSGPSLWENQGDGTFTDVTSTAVIGATGTGGGVWGDYDNDGCLDYFGQGGSYAVGETLLHNNCDGTLTNVIEEAGINDMQDQRDCDGNGEPEHSPTEGVAWFDLDGDGLLDLYMANYECSSDFDFFQNYDDFLWRNNGDGTFSDWTALAGLDQTNQAGRGVTTGDPDMDGDTDIFVSNYRLDRNYFYSNLGDGTVDDVSTENGTKGVYELGAYGHTIGSVFGDIDNDGDMDMVHANLAHPFYIHFSDKSMVLINDGTGVYENQAEERGIYYRETHSNPSLFDADNDGDLDLFITSIYGGRDSDFYENDGAGYFTLRNHESGLVTENGWGSSVADFDNDGDVDLITKSLFRNEWANDNHWLQVRLVGGAPDAGLSNRSAIGATVSLSSGSFSQLRQVSGGSGTSVQDSLVQHFGLGLDETVHTLSVLFPGGGTVELVDITADQLLWVHEDGRTAVGYAPPEW